MKMLFPILVAFLAVSVTGQTVPIIPGVTLIHGVFKENEAKPGHYCLLVNK